MRQSRADSERANRAAPELWTFSHAVTAFCLTSLPFVVIAPWRLSLLSDERCCWIFQPHASLCLRRVEAVGL